jgi:hypothetical protein
MGVATLIGSGAVSAGEAGVPSLNREEPGPADRDPVGGHLGHEAPLLSAAAKLQLPGPWSGTLAARIGTLDCCQHTCRVYCPAADDGLQNLGAR